MHFIEINSGCKRPHGWCNGQNEFSVGKDVVSGLQKIQKGILTRLGDYLDMGSEVKYV